MLAETTFGPYLLPCLTLVIISVVIASSRGPKLPDVPWINHDPDLWFAKLRARWRTTFNFQESIRYAYQQVCDGSVITWTIC